MALTYSVTICEQKDKGIVHHQGAYNINCITSCFNL